MKEGANAMNSQRRKALREIITQLEELKCTVDDILYEEEKERDSMPENKIDTKEYEKADAAVDNLDDAVCTLDEAIFCIEAAIK